MCSSKNMCVFTNCISSFVFLKVCLEIFQSPNLATLSAHAAGEILPLSPVACPTELKREGRKLVSAIRIISDN